MRLLPLFPLSLVAFPGEKLNLHIFEPRYRQLVHDCATEGQTFGITPYIDNAVQPIGTEMRLVSIDKTYPAGESDIRTEAVGVFAVRELLALAPGKLYGAAYIDDGLPDDPAADEALRLPIVALVQELYAILNLQALFAKLPPRFGMYEVAHHLGLSIEQEYELLTMRHEPERQRFVQQHLVHILPVLRETERLKDRVRQNGHFKHLTPPHF